MNNEFIKIINDMTQDIINLYNIKMPIENIEDIVVKLGGSIKLYPKVNANGYDIEKKPDGFIIHMYNYSNNCDKNFQIARSLGELFLCMGYKINNELWNNTYSAYISNDLSRIRQTIEFAYAFLMPETEYKKVMDKYTVGDVVETDKIADYFGVSVSAASHRGKVLGYLQKTDLDFYNCLEKDKEEIEEPELY